MQVTSEMQRLMLEDMGGADDIPEGAMTVEDVAALKGVGLNRAGKIALALWKEGVWKRGWRNGRYWYWKGRVDNEEEGQKEEDTA